MSEAATELTWSAEEASTPANEAAAVLAFAGDLDLATVPEFDRVLAEEGGRLVVLDLRRVRFIDSSGIHAVVRAGVDRPDGDGNVQIVVAPDSAVDRVLRMTGLREELHPHPDADSALAALGDGAGGE